MIAKQGKVKNKWETPRRTTFLLLSVATAMCIFGAIIPGWLFSRNNFSERKVSGISSTMSRPREGARYEKSKRFNSLGFQDIRLSTMNDWCVLKASVISDNSAAAALTAALQAKRNVYVGSAGQKWFGWESFSQEELDVTIRAQFFHHFCPGDVQAFLSEHTFEHIYEADTRRAFSYFYEFLAPGGHLRVAMPSYPPGHRSSPVDAKYGHVNFLSADALVQMMESVGFEKVEKLEWVDHSKGVVHTRYWNVCEGPVRRSVQLDDDRSQTYLFENCRAVNRSEGKMPPGLNSLLATNVIPERLVAKSSIVQGYKRV